MSDPMRMTLKIKFREHLKVPPGKKDVDICGFRLYGHFPVNIGAILRTGLMTEHIFEASSSLEDSQLASFWFHFREPISYGRIMRMADTVVSQLEKNGYVKIRVAVENLICKNVHFTDGHDNEPHSLEYNVANGFTVVLEKPGTTSLFTIDDVDEIKQLAINLSGIIYGRLFKVIC